jgi:hypothetical protein
MPRSRRCSYERERVVVFPLAHARSYTSQAGANFGVSDPLADGIIRNPLACCFCRSGFIPDTAADCQA